MAARPDRGRELRVCVAQIGAAHGLKGDVRLRSFTEDPQAFAQYGPLETEDRKRSLEIESMRPAGDAFVIRFRGVADRNAAEALRDVKLYVERDKLPAAEDDEFYHADLVGLVAVTTSGELFGDVVGIHNFGAGDIVELKIAGSGETVMLLFDQETFPAVDIPGGRIVVDPPAEIIAKDDDESEPS
jgi:16S rRNA processing protein RimM